MEEKFLCSVLEPCVCGEILAQCVGALQWWRNFCAVCWSLVMGRNFCAVCWSHVMGEKFLRSVLEPCNGVKTLVQCVGAL